MEDFEINRGFTFTKQISIFDSSGNQVDLSAYDDVVISIKTTSITYDFSKTSGHISIVLPNTINFSLSPTETESITNGSYVLYLVSGTNKLVVIRGAVKVYPDLESNIDYLIPYLRIKLGDVSATRYSTDWLRTALLLAVRVSQRYLNNKYLVDDNNSVYRNPDYPYFVQEYGIIEARDEPIIVLLAAIIVLEGSLENSAWDAVSWRDNEISFSNLEQFRTRGDVLDKLVDELNSLLLPPVKRLAKPMKVGMPGYNYNPEEKKTRY
jgi:hypothetical protein